MVASNEEKEVLLVMTKEPDASKWNLYEIPQSPDSSIEYGAQLKRGRKILMAKSVKDRRRKIKMPKIQTSCCCAANCNCKCLKCICQQQKIAVAGNAEVIRVRKQARKKRTRTREKRKSPTPTLVTQLTELVRANRKRAGNVKKKQESEPRSTGQAKKETKPPVQTQSGTPSARSGSNKSESEAKDPHPTHGNPADDAMSHSRKRKRQHHSYGVQENAKQTKKVRHQTKKRRIQKQYVSLPPSIGSGSAINALAKIRKLRKQARERNQNPKPHKKSQQ